MPYPTGLDETGFRTRHPEFKGAASGLVQIKLADALRRTGPLFGDSFDEAHGWLTAHLLASTPWGMAARLDTQKAPPGVAMLPGDTIYSAQRRMMALEFGTGIGVI